MIEITGHDEVRLYVTPRINRDHSILCKIKYGEDVYMNPRDGLSLSVGTTGLYQHYIWTGRVFRIK